MRFGMSVVLALALGGCTSETPISPLGEGYEYSEAPELQTPEQEDRVVQVQVPKVDVLFVIDNSGSMGDEQQALADNFPMFMNYFLGSGLDYHIGVVSTDTDSSSTAGALRTVTGISYIDTETANPSQVFQQMAALGTGGSNTEQGREAAYVAVEVRSGAGQVNEGFIREEAALHLVFVSDEDDYSGADVITKAEFIEWMKTEKWSPDMVTAHGIVGKSLTCGAERSDAYIDYVNATGGVLFEICERDWAPVLNELGLQAAGLKREYFLSEVPVPETIEARVTSDSVTQTFGLGEELEYNSQRNSIIFTEFVPEPFAEVFVKYQLLSALEEVEEELE